jgi:hypothetical protein
MISYLRALGLVLGLLGCTGSRPPAESGPSRNKGDLGAFLEEARACSSDEECVHLGDYCGAGCAVTVNRRHQQEAEERLRANPERCNIDCPPVGPPLCQQGRCASPDR